MPFGDLRDIISSIYNIEGDISERITFTYETFIGDKGNSKCEHVKITRPSRISK